MLKIIAYLAVAITASAIGSGISDTFVSGFISGVLAAGINEMIERGKGGFA
jgi:uncharacterized protein YgfB (UPF0149 family)